MKKMLVGILVLACAVSHAQNVNFAISTDHADALYRCGD